MCLKRPLALTDSVRARCRRRSGKPPRELKSEHREGDRGKRPKSHETALCHGGKQAGEQRHLEGVGRSAEPVSPNRNARSAVGKVDETQPSGKHGGGKLSRPAEYLEKLLRWVTEAVRE